MYEPDVYDRAIKHVQDLYRSEGYLSASVGPVQVLRRACAPRSPRRAMPANRTRAKAADGLPLRRDRLAAGRSSGRPIAVLCAGSEARREARAVAGAAFADQARQPRATLYDLGFEGNRVIVE